jgi:hypothetical protein
MYTKFFFFFFFFSIYTIKFFFFFLVALGRGVAQAPGLAGLTPESALDVAMEALVVPKVGVAMVHGGSSGVGSTKEWKE